MWVPPLRNVRFLTRNKAKNRLLNSGCFLRIYILVPMLGRSTKESLSFFNKALAEEVRIKIVKFGQYVFFIVSFAIKRNK